MNDGLISQKQIRSFMAIALVLAALLAVVLIHRSATFRITGTSPSVNSVATLSPFFKISFNRPLAEGVSVTVSPQNFPTSYRVDGSVITVTFNKQMQEGQTYTVSLAHIADSSGSHLPNKTFSFQAQYISSDSLPPDQQKALEANQARYNAIKNDGLVKLLPFTGGGNEFQISYTVSYSAQTPRLIIVVTTANSQGQADAINWISEVGFDPSKYTITFVTPASDE